MAGVQTPTGPGGQAVQVMRWGTTQKISPAGSSVALTNAFAAATELVRVKCSAAMNVTFGASPTATTNDPLMSAGETEYIGVKSGDKLAAIGTGDVYVTEAVAIS